MGKLHNLAVNSAPTFKCLIPSKGKMVKMRAFLVKEQKLLLIAKEADDKVETVRSAVSQLIQNCILEDISVDSLPSFDVEYMFVQLFMHSTASKTTNSAYRCLTPIKDESGEVILDDEGNPKTCGTINQVKIDLSAAKVETSKIKDGVISVGSESIDKLVFQYMDFERRDRYSYAALDKDLDTMFEIIGSCLTAVYEKDGNVQHLGTDYEVEDTIELLEHMPSDVFERIIEFFTETPTLTATTKFKCKSCGTETDLRLSGLEDFF